MIILLHRGNLYALYTVLKKFASKDKVVVLASKEKMTATCAKYAQMIEGMVCSFVLVSNYDKSGQLENYVYHFHLTAKIKLVFAVAEFDLYGRTE